MYKREGEKGKILFLGLDNLIYIAGEMNKYIASIRIHSESV